MSKIDEIAKIIENRLKGLEFRKSNLIVNPFTNLENSLKEFEESKKISNKSGIDIFRLELYLSELYEDLNNRKGNQKSDETSFNVFTKLPLKPYAQSYIGSTVTLSRGTNYSEEVLPSKTIFTQLLPGQVTHRWDFHSQWRVPCGKYYEDFISHLKGIHKISSTPFIQHEGKNVHTLEKINVMTLQGVTSNSYVDENGEEQKRQGGIPVCPECLSINISGGRVPEQCIHVRDGNSNPVGRSSLYASPILENIEISGERKISKPNHFSFPLNEMFEKIEFLENCQIVTVATGFTREIGGVSIQVQYDPYIGYKTDTNGLLFVVKEIPGDFVKQVLNDDFLVRDILIDILQDKILHILNSLNKSSFELEVWLSGLIKALRLDSISTTFDYLNTLNQLHSASFDDDFLSCVQTELSYYEYEQFGIDPTRIAVMSNEIKNINISEDDLKLKIKRLLKNSLTYLIHQTGLVTSGSTDQDIGFIYPKENTNEILLFDDVSGGNGASKLINDYLIGVISSYSPKHGARPKYFQETFFELLQPCPQGTADRSFFQDLVKIFTNFSNNNLISKKFEEIQEQQNVSQDEFEQIKISGIQNMFPHSIGKRGLIQNGITNTTESKKIQEIANICIHGCFECGLLKGNYSGIKGPKLEKFYVSKYLLDKYFKFVTQKIRIDIDTNTSEIEKIFKEHKMVIISQKIGNANDIYQVMSKMNSLIGEEFDEKLVKFSGLWFDCPISNSPEVELSILLSVIK